MSDYAGLYNVAQAIDNVAEAILKLAAVNALTHNAHGALNDFKIEPADIRDYARHVKQ